MPGSMDVALRPMPTGPASTKRQSGRDRASAETSAMLTLCSWTAPTKPITGRGSSGRAAGDLAACRKASVSAGLGQ